MSNLPFKIFSGRSSEYLASKIADNLDVELGAMNILNFADGEFQVSYEESVRGDEVYLVQSKLQYFGHLIRRVDSGNY